MKLPKNYFKFLTLALLLSTLCFSSLSLAKVNSKGWVIGAGFTKSFYSKFKDTYIEEDLDTSGLKLLFDYQIIGVNSNHRNGIEVASTEYKLKDFSSEKATVTSINYVYKNISKNNRFNIYGGFKAGLHITPDFNEDNTFGLGLGSTLGILTKITNNLELDTGINLHFIIMEEINYCDYNYCESAQPIITDFNFNLGLNYHF